jgi:hypothetical protein
MACSITALEDGNSQTVASYISISEHVIIIFRRHGKTRNINTSHTLKKLKDNTEIKIVRQKIQEVQDSLTSWR